MAKTIQKRDFEIEKLTYDMKGISSPTSTMLGFKDTAYF